MKGIKSKNKKEGIWVDGDNDAYGNRIDYYFNEKGFIVGTIEN